MSSSHAAVESIHAALCAADAQLMHLSTRIQSEISTSMPPNIPNPAVLHFRIRTLQSQLNNLRELLLKAHHQKSQLATLCRGRFIEAMDFARAVQPRDTSQRSILESRYTKLNTILGRFDDSYMRAVATPTNHRKNELDLNLALLHANAAVSTYEDDSFIDNNNSNDDAEEQNVEIEDKENDTNSRNCAADAPKGKGKGKSKLRKPEDSKNTVRKDKKTEQVKSEQSNNDKEFEPVSKTIFNRLPRNLKIKAGKLADVNQLYERVFNILKDVKKPLSEKEMLKKCGEVDTSKLDVLRGLAVIRCTKQGWQLA